MASSKPYLANSNCTDFSFTGETNTFKFSTEHVSSSLSEQGYESVSESEDEESVDVDEDEEASEVSTPRPPADLDSVASAESAKKNVGDANSLSGLSLSEVSESLREPDTASAETAWSAETQASSSVSSATSLANSAHLAAARSESCATLNANEVGSMGETNSIFRKFNMSI